jgi:hypothetical protein
MAVHPPRGVGLGDPALVMKWWPDTAWGRSSPHGKAGGHGHPAAERHGVERWRGEQGRAAAEREEGSGGRLI